MDTDMVSSKELWNEKTLALLTSNPTLGAYASTALPSTPTISASVEPEAEMYPHPDCPDPPHRLNVMLTPD